MRSGPVLIVGAILLTLAAPAAAGEAGWSEAPAELIDPWAPRATASTPPTAEWDIPEAVELLDPWKQPRSRPRAKFVIIDPWEGRPAGIPTAAFPPVSLVDPWQQPE